jgi:hypothetical protein
MSVKRGIGLAVVIGLLSGCASYETFEPPPLDFSHHPTLDLAVERIPIDSVYRAAAQPPYVDHLMPVTPEAATRAMLMQRLRAVGGPDRLQVLILDASVEEETLKPETGLRGYLLAEPIARLHGRIKVQVDQLDPAGVVVRSASTAVARTRAIPEDTGYAERERIGYELVRDLVNDLDVGLSANIANSFSRLIRS